MPSNERHKGHLEGGGGGLPSRYHLTVVGETRHFEYTGEVLSNPLLNEDSKQLLPNIRSVSLGQAETRRYAYKERDTEKRSTNENVASNKKPCRSERKKRQRQLKSQPNGVLKPLLKEALASPISRQRRTITASNRGARYPLGLLRRPIRQ